MRRRELIGWLGGAAAWPLVARAQQSGKAPRVALIFPNAPVSDMAGPDPINRYARVFVHALRDLGYVEGSNLILERRSAEGQYERLEEIVIKLVQAKIDVIVTPTSVLTEAAKRAAIAVPIVMAGTLDPVAAGLVASLARPGGNITGFTFDVGPGVEGKRLHLLKEAVPAATRIAYFGTKSEWERHYAQEARTAAQKLQVTLVPTELNPTSYTDALSFLSRERVQAVFASSNGAHFVNRRLIADFSLTQRLPGAFTWRDIAEAGGLMSYGADYSDILRKAAGYVDKILRGAKPADLPVEQPTKYELVINLKTAKALAVSAPATLLASADEVIE